MEPAPERTTRWMELASRTSDGVEVTLLWERDQDNVQVRVIDARTEKAFELAVAGEKALEVFYHPYAYAA